MDALFNRKTYMDYWHFTQQDTDDLIKRLTIALPALRGAVRATQDELANAIGVSRQTYNVVESQKKKMSWNTYMALLLFFDYNPNSHIMIRQLEAFPPQLDECWLLNESQSTTEDGHTDLPEYEGQDL